MFAKLTENLFVVILLFCSYNSYGQWTEIQLGVGQSAKTLHFLDDSLGYVLLNDETDNTVTLEKTVDAGDNWVELELPVPSGEFQDIHFYHEGEGVVIVRNLSDDTVPTRVFRTMDDGASWEDISPSATATGLGRGQCQFLNANIGFLATDKFLYTTTDSGATWTTREFDNYILSIDFLDAEYGTLGTWDGTFGYRGGILTTSDGGTTWTNHALDENYTSIMEVRQISREIALAAPVHSWAAIQAGQFYKTTDGGDNWAVVEIPKPEDDCTLRQIDFKDNMNGLVCVGNTSTTHIYQTTDGGQTWMEEDAIPSVFDLDLQLTPSSGYIGGVKGVLYKRTISTAVGEAPALVDISVFPSPVQAGQRVYWSSTEQFTHVSIIGQTGQVIHQQQIAQNYVELPLLPPGVYFIQLRNKKVMANAKLLVE